MIRTLFHKKFYCRDNLRTFLNLIKKYQSFAFDKFCFCQKRQAQQNVVRRQTFAKHLCSFGIVDKIYLDKMLILLAILTNREGFSYLSRTTDKQGVS